jgi:hypothetical protein
MAVAPLGLLVRGQPVPPAQDKASNRPFVALLDPLNGKVRWDHKYERGSGLTSFVTDTDEIFIASDEGLSRFSLAEGVVSPLTTGKVPGAPVISLEVQNDMMLVAASQSLTLVGLDGVQRYQTEYPAPSMGLGGRLLRLSLGIAAIAAGGYFSGGFLAGTAFARYQYSTSSQSSAHVYFVLRDYAGQGPALAKIEKATGEITGVVTLSGDKRPEYMIDEASGLIVLKSDRALTAYSW